jgi:hypothetical protein
MLVNTIKELSEERPCDCAEALRHSIMTSPDAISEETKEKLKPIIEGFI